MIRTFTLGWLGLTLFALVPTLPAFAADDPGQADLDQATDIKIAAETLADLEKVVSLCESAIRKGLSKENEPFAKQLLASTLYQHASKLSSAIFDQTPPDPRWPALRQLSVRNLEKALKHDASLSEVH